MNSWDDGERAALVALLRSRPEGMTWSQITAEVAEDGSARAVWERLSPPSLFGMTRASADALNQARSEVVAWRRADFRFLTFHDEAYPTRFREVHQAPPVIFTKGALRPRDRAVSVVGSRKASTWALTTAAEIATELIELGVTVVSGLAEGIDTAAHTAALQANGRTVAVLGTGIRNVYPATNRDLQEQIAESGLVLSQFWPDAPPTKQTFPMRNATMSAYGIATVVVEAGEYSGARIQARTAVEHGRPVILLSSVAQGTNWGRDLVGQPGVSVARNADEVRKHVESLDREEDQVTRLLSLTDL